jgi:hypothetical protein
MHGRPGEGFSGFCEPAGVGELRLSIRCYWGAVALVALALGALRATAAPVADSFATSGSGAYTAPAVLNGQNPGIPGFSGAWSGSTKFSAITTGLNDSGVTTYAKGGAAELVGATADAAQNVSRSVTVPSSSTYYMSALVIRGNSSSITPGSYALIGFGNGVQPNTATTNSSVQGLYMGFVQTASQSYNAGGYNDFGSLIIRTRQDIGGTQENVDTILVDGEGNSTNEVTYFVVAKVSVNTSGSNDTLQYWVNPTSLSSDSAMSSSALVTNTITVNTITSSADLTKLMLAEQSYNATIDFDEPRIATNLADLAAATPTPEPSTVGLVLLTAAGLLGRRRK